MKPVQSNQTLLRKSLKANAVFSVISGVIIALLSSPLATLLFAGQSELFGMSMTTVLLIIGSGVAIFGIDVWLVARPAEINLFQAKLVFVMDILWVVGSAAQLTLWPELFTTTGLVAIALVAIAVADFALVEFLGIRKSAVPPDASMEAAAQTG